MPALLTQHGKLKFTMISGADSSRFIYVPGLVPTRQSENVSGIGMSASSRLQGHLAGVQNLLNPMEVSILNCLHPILQIWEQTQKVILLIKVTLAQCRRPV